MTKLSNSNSVTRVVVDLGGGFYPNAIAAEIRRLLQNQFGWRTISKVKSRVLMIKKWEKDAPDEADAPSLPYVQPISRLLVQDLVEALSEYVSPEQTVQEYVEQNKEAACHKGLVSVYACTRCSKNINAIRALQLAKEHGLLE